MSEHRPAGILSDVALRERLVGYLEGPPSRAAMVEMATMVYELREEIDRLLGELNAARLQVVASDNDYRAALKEIERLTPEPK